MAKGVKALLSAAANDKAQTTKAKTKTPEYISKDVNPVEKTSEEIESKETAPKKSVTTNKGGRPTNKEKGIISRKQYTLTLKEETYELIKTKAQEEEISFAKYMERAALEYIENHS